MKKLLLIRHARAVHETGYTDFERPLQYSGLHDAGLMAARLQENAIIPQILISSPALRTVATANIFSEHLSIPKADLNKEIYEAERETLVSLVDELPANHDFIGLVGHNPGLSQLLFYLTGEMRDMETCATALIEFWVEDWAAIINGSGIITYYSFPGE